MRSWLVFSLLLAAGSASADNYDFQIYKLGNPQPGGTGYTPLANGNFRVFARQLAAAMTSVTLMPPETLGHAGFAFSLEGSMVFINEDLTGANGVTLPTQRSTLCMTGAAGCGALGWSSGMSSQLYIPSFHVRKGLPYSFEIGGRLGWIEQSRMFTGMLELKWAINEGFTYLPDIAIGGRIAKLLNSRDFDLTTGGLDVSVGKKFALGGMITLTPYVGWNLMFVGATSGQVDFNPNRTLGQAELPSQQFTDIYIFSSLSSSANTHNRFYGGVRFIGRPFMLGIEGSYTIIGSFQDADSKTNRQVPAVPAFNLTVGLDL